MPPGRRTRRKRSVSGVGQAAGQAREIRGVRQFPGQNPAQLVDREPVAGGQLAAFNHHPGYTVSNLAMTSVSASPSRVHSWNAGSAIIVSM